MLKNLFLVDLFFEAMDEMVRVFGIKKGKQLNESFNWFPEFDSTIGYFKFFTKKSVILVYRCMRVFPPLILWLRLV